MATKQELIKDLGFWYEKNGGHITRNFYRANGKYTEATWQKEFATFAAFMEAAGLSNVEQAEVEDVPETNEITEDHWKIEIPKTHIHTLAQLVEVCKIDLSIWEVEKFIVNKYEVAMKLAATTEYMETKDGRSVPSWVRKGQDTPVVQPLYQVKAFLRKKKDVIAAKDEIAALKEFAKKEAHVPMKIERDSFASGNMLEVNLPDVHFGKLAWGVETGYEPYDVKIAEQMHDRAVETILHRASPFKFDKVLYVVGNDILNSDDLEGRTTKGTSVTTDGRYHKTFFKVRELLIRTIERLRQIAPVHVMIVPGNHDTLSAWHLGDSLECYFHKYDDVKIDNVPVPRKYLEWGKVMLMFTHGDKGKRSDYPLLMATERPEMFGRTKWREAHVGHLHFTKLDEQHGVRVRMLPALCPPDDWHAENGFVGNLRNAEGYIWNKDEGMVATVYYSDQAFPQIVTQRQFVEKEKKSKK